eukprot:NODE_3886_length_624_cov_109.968696_g2799_i0.p1 GENE.NODE_3886_length_624_cov_109.968696_g2799_i0~~NODE_3886_length_624_cov_109.968696_g2799_i0.p1  ORF type:complete len:96 (+),score=41.35 NODE_3886_length_624_cov_109.968696_g2799_i0:34-288(+)
MGATAIVYQVISLFLERTSSQLFFFAAVMTIPIVVFLRLRASYCYADYYLEALPDSDWSPPPHHADDSASSDGRPSKDPVSKAV